jgi:hypothetical protein
MVDYRWQVTARQFIEICRLRLTETTHGDLRTVDLCDGRGAHAARPARYGKSHTAAANRHPERPGTSIPPRSGTGIRSLGRSLAKENLIREVPGGVKSLQHVCSIGLVNRQNAKCWAQYSASASSGTIRAVCESSSLVIHHWSLVIRMRMTNDQWFVACGLWAGMLLKCSWRNCS